MVLVQTLTICHHWSCPGPGTQAVTETRLTAFYIHAYTSLSLDTPTIGEGEIHGDLLLWPSLWTLTMLQMIPLTLLLVTSALATEVDLLDLDTVGEHQRLLKEITTGTEDKTGKAITYKSAGENIHNIIFSKWYSNELTFRRENRTKTNVLQTIVYSMNNL